MNSKETLEKHYIHRINEKDDGHTILDWENREAHLGRFNVLTENLNLSGMRILDVGCGIGDLYRFIQEKGIEDISYTGIDILEEMVKEARRRSPEGNFLYGDMFETSIFSEKSFDVVYSSGIFNLNFGGNMQFLLTALEKFFCISKKWLVFNLLHPDHYVQDEKYFYVDPVKAEKLVSAYTNRYFIVDDAVPYDYTVFAELP
ncbi:MAG: class I SAM-dependent methyltransferase [Spirochaetales bacterium]|nr:class I SAM-dependent methyltransferase [Spirochaetales bacterium]